MVLGGHSPQPRSSIGRREASEAAPTAGANYSARCHLEQETSGGPSGGHERLRAPSSIARTGTRQRARIDCYYYATAASEQTGLCHSNKLVVSQRRILLPFKNLNALALTPALVQQDKQLHQDQQQRQPLESVQMQQIEKVHKATSTPTATALTTTAIATTTSFTPTATATCAASAATTCALRATQAASGAAPGAINSHLSAHHHSDKLVSASIAFGHKTTRQAASARLLIPTFGHWTLPFALTLIFIVCLGDLIFASVSLISAGQQSSRRAQLAERVVARRADELAPRPAPVPSSSSPSSSPSQSLQASEWAHNQRHAHDTQSADLARARALASAQTVDGVDLRADESEPQIVAESRAAETQFGLRTRRLPTDHLHQSTKTNLALPPAPATAAVSSTKGRPPNQAAHIERGQLAEPLSYRQFGATRASSIPALNRSAAKQEDGQWIPIVRSSSAANNAQDSKASNHSGQAASMRSNTSAQMDNQYLDDSARSQSRPPIGERASAPRTSTRSQHPSIGRARQPLDGTESRIELYASLGVQPRHQQLHESGHRAHRHNHHRQRLNNQLNNNPPHQYHFQRRPRLSTHHHQLEQANELGLGSLNAGKMYKRVLLCDKTLVSLDYVRYLEPEPRPFALGPIYKTTVASPSSPLHALDPTDSSNLIDEVLNDLGDNLIELDGQYSSLASKHAEAALNRSADAQPDSPTSAGSLGRRERANSNEYRLPMVAQQPQQSGSSSRALDGGAHFDASAPTRDPNSTSSAPAADHSPLRLGAAESAVLEVRGSGGGGGSYLLNDQDPLVRCDMWDLEKGLKSRKPPEHLLRVAIKADFDTVRDAINRCRQLSEKTLPPEDEYRDGLEIMSTEDLISLFSIKRGLIPGTKWCGLGDQANSYNDLGPKHRIDICCRAHDHCPIRSKPFRNDYGVLNIGLYTKSHCDCDADFYRCLREVRSRAADMLGNLYFNVMKLQCMREERLKICREMKPIALGFERCIRYEDSPIKTVFKFTTPPVAY